MYTDTDSIAYEVIAVKKYMNSNSTEIKLAQIRFKGEHIELFYVSEIIYQGGPVGSLITAGAYCEQYVKKAGENLIASEDPRDPGSGGRISFEPSPGSVP